MIIEEELYSLWSSDPTVTAVCPVERIKPPGVWQELVRPYIVHFGAAVEPLHDNTNFLALRIWDYQISIFTDSYSSGRALEQIMIAATDGHHVATSSADEGFQCTWTSHGYVKESDTGVHHFTLGFTISEGLA